MNETDHFMDNHEEGRAHWQQEITTEGKGLTCTKTNMNESEISYHKYKHNCGSEWGSSLRALPALGQEPYCYINSRHQCYQRVW